jgi:hypothetical protein
VDERCDGVEGLRGVEGCVVAAAGTTSLTRCISQVDRGSGGGGKRGEGGGGSYADSEPAFDRVYLPLTYHMRVVQAMKAAPPHSCACFCLHALMSMCACTCVTPPLGDESELAAKKALAVLSELWRRKVWRDARTVNCIGECVCWGGV